MPSPAAQDVAEQVDLEAFQPLWRRHSDAVNTALVQRWLPARPRRILKTDLFDEAVSDGVYPALAQRGHVVGIDRSDAVVAAARARHPALQAVHADVRDLPFADGEFDAVLSLSTLDHFETLAGLSDAVRELHRALAPGGTLLLTLDNAANPAVRLRNALPFRLLHRLGLVPYSVGATCGPATLRRALADAGFRVERVDAVMHAPRAPAVAAAGLLGRHAGPRAQRRFLALLSRLEVLGRLPTRYVTGYFVAARARRP